MKKKMIGAITLSMMLAGAGTVYAADGIGSGGSDSSPVTGTYEAGASAETVYSVDIAWEGLSFTYHGADEGTWDPDTHQYEGSTEAGWEEGKGTISITNHSNTDVNASASYEAAEGFETTNMEFSENDLTVGSADNGEDGGAGTAVKETITVTPSGTLPEGTENKEIGHITVTIK